MRVSTHTTAYARSKDPLPECGSCRSLFRSTPKRTRSTLLRCVAAALALAMGPHHAVAGGGPETTLIVVNADSPLSIRIANTYADLRDIPQSHLVWLHGVPSLGTIDIDTFRNRVWNPIREFVSTHGMADQIDTIAYSSDFPYSVNVSSDIRANKLPKNRYRGTIASLTGLTYFARRVEIGDAGYLHLYANQYFRRNLAPGSTPIELTEAQQQLAKDAEKALKEKTYENAEKRYRELTQTGMASAWYGLARSLGALGRTDEAMAALEQAVDAGLVNSMHARGDSHLKSLQTLPEFPVLLERIETHNGPFEPAHGFRSRYFWDRWTLPSPMHAATTLNRYYLSTLLAYTGVRGNSAPEVRRYLTSAAASDGTHPDGAVYLMVNGDVRSQARQRFFPATITMLEKRDRRAEMLTRGKDGQNGIIPMGKDDVIGVVAGTNKFDWQKSGSTLLPGAIGEALTSYGGHFNNGKQTKLTEFLRHGAAGSSGAVAEPYSIQEKFPVAVLHGYYADGSSLAEAFYQSISGPYQLIIVGDPLARPFAYFAKIDLEVPDRSLPWQGTVTIRPRITPAMQRPIERVELWVDGVRVGEAQRGESIVWDTRKVDDGSHELRLVAVEAGRIETRSFNKFHVSIKNNDKHIQVAELEIESRLGEPIELSGKALHAQRVAVMRGHRVLASGPVLEGAWQLSLPSANIGLGRALIFVRATFPDKSSVRSRPVPVRILEPHRTKATYMNGQTVGGLKGELFTADGMKRNIVLKALDGNLRLLPKGRNDRIRLLRLEGALHIGSSGFYQFVISARGRFRIKIDDQDFNERSMETTNDEVFFALSLEAGWHRLFIELFPADAPYLKMVAAGDQVAEVLSERILRHQPPTTTPLDQGAENTEPPPKAIPAQVLCGKSGPLLARIETLESKRSAMLTKYTEKHPDIVELDRQIGFLQYEIENLKISNPACSGNRSKVKP